MYDSLQTFGTLLSIYIRSACINGTASWPKNLRNTYNRNLWCVKVAEAFSSEECPRTCTRLYYGIHSGRWRRPRIAGEICATNVSAWGCWTDYSIGPLPHTAIHMNDSAGMFQLYGYFLSNLVSRRQSFLPHIADAPPPNRNKFLCENIWPISISVVCPCQTENTDSKMCVIPNKIIGIPAMINMHGMHWAVNWGNMSDGIRTNFCLPRMQSGNIMC